MLVLQEPEDELAEVLFERIKAEKAKLEGKGKSKKKNSMNNNFKNISNMPT
ncbi:MAG: hypothetical protein GWP12_01255 [Nitrospirae bacterium]|nr:hypothetical protein [Nitrospirota bacterium]